MAGTTRTDLADEIGALRIVDTHEHLVSESRWLAEGPDILVDLFGHYVQADLVTAGATPEAMERLRNPAAGDIAGRFEGIRHAWEATQHTGYGEAVRTVAAEVYGIEELTASVLEQAQSKLEEIQRRPGEMYRLLSDVANLDHVQIHDFQRTRHWESAHREFFLHDLCWWQPCRGEIPVEAIYEETGIEVTSLERLREAFAEIFRRFAPSSIAVKSAHAYHRTLVWEERSDDDAARALATVLEAAAGADGSAGSWPPPGSSPASIVLGDWCWARGVELAIEHDLPFKIHTGYLAGNGGMLIDRIRPGNLCALLARYPDARFVLMHAGYPYGDELVAVAKHYPNVWVDLCWAWSIDPFSTVDFVRRFLHAVPANKLFAFGGDTFWATNVLAYATQARLWLKRLFEAEVAQGHLTEQEALALASRITHDNQYACFDVEGTRAALLEPVV